MRYAADLMDEYGANGREPRAADRQVVFALAWSVSAATEGLDVNGRMTLILALTHTAINYGRRNPVPTEHKP